MHKVPFFKLEGAGNDFLVFFSKDCPVQGAEKSKFVQRMGHRQFGIGSDQLLEVESLDPLAIQIWNCDGSRAEMSGNGARTFAKLAHQEGWLKVSGDSAPLKISGRDFSVWKVPDGFAVNLGKPQFKGVETIVVNDEPIPMYLNEVPNPHAVVFIGDAKNEWAAPPGFFFKTWGSAIETHPRFPQKTNVEFVYDFSFDGAEAKAEAKVWERGAGATLSSGSGATSIATALREVARKQNKELPNLVRVSMNGFELRVRFNAQGEALLDGPAKILARGDYYV